ncbi:hypothetical protein NDU88_003848 [Pleurodeles waltl]|uniref:Uncharacterized protein n=1 Tax=Pleurodeles waltl TaxID=8319 RepID=A0AAV7MT34_PLEWA|nr:hypothetical protein NDU88_003848 [Pleurodeles waltl]
MVPTIPCCKGSVVLRPRVLHGVLSRATGVLRDVQWLPRRSPQALRVSVRREELAGCMRAASECETHLRRAWSSRDKATKQKRRRSFSPAPPRTDSTQGAG